MFLKLIAIQLATLKGTGIFLFPRRDAVDLFWGRRWLLIQPAETEWIESYNKIITSPWDLGCQEVSGVSHCQQVVIDLRTRLFFYHFIWCDINKERILLYVNREKILESVLGIGNKPFWKRSIKGYACMGQFFYMLHLFRRHSASKVEELDEFSLVTEMTTLCLIK